MAEPKTERAAEATPDADAREPGSQPQAVAVLTLPRGALVAGQLVRGDETAIAALIEAKGALQATPEQVARAAHFIHPIPEV